MILERPRAEASPEQSGADLLVIGCGVVAALHVGKLPGALPVLREAFGLTLVQAGFLLSMVQVSGMALALVLGLAAGRWGLKRALLAGLGLLAVASAGGAYAGQVSALMAWRVVEGLGFLLVTVAAPALLRRLVAAQRLSRRMGLWGTFMPAGTAAALFLGPWAMGLAGWRGWWLLMAAAAAGMAAWAWWVVPRDPPSSGGARSHWAAPLRMALGTPGPWLVALTFGAYSGQWLTVIGFLPTVYADAGVGAEWAGGLTALAALANVTGNIASGHLLHRGQSPRRLLLTGFAAMAVGAGVAFGLDGLAPPALRYGAVLLFSSVGGLIPGTLFALAVRVAPDESAVPAAVGWTLQWSAIGQFCGPPLAAWWAHEQGGWQQTGWVTGAAAVVGAALAWALDRTLRRAGAREPAQRKPI